jgi:prevent-host-death family protein
MKPVNMHEAKTQFSKLIAKVEAGEDVIIARNGKPVAKLIRIMPTKRAKFGFAKGTIKIIGDINDPMPDEWLEMFYNAPLTTDEDPYFRGIDGAKTLKPRKSTRKAS